MAGVVEGNLLFAYALLKANASVGSPSPISSLSPLIYRSFHSPRSNAAAGSILLSHVVDDVAKKYGLEIPIYVAEYCARELVKKNVLVFEKATGGYYVASSADGGFDKIESAARESYNLVVSKIARILIDEGSKIEPDAFLEEWLDSSAISFLGGSARAYNAEPKDYQNNRLMRVAIDRFGDDFLSGLADLAIGDAIFRAIRELSQYASIEEATEVRKIETVAIMDTPIVMGFFGWSSEYRQLASRQMISMCKSLGVRIGVLQMSIDEIERIFTGAASNLSHGNAPTGEIRAYVFENGLSASDLVVERAMLQTKICEEFELISPPALTTELSISERQLEYLIASKVRQRYPDARKHDVDALAAVYRLRNGEEKTYFERSDAIFVTGNKSLADSGTIFFQELFREDGRRNQVQIAMHQTVFSSRLWVKLPTISSGVARPQIISHVSASLMPNPKLREAFLSELKKLSDKGAIGEQDAAIVRISTFADEVLGDRFSYDKITISEAETRGVVSDAINMIRDWRDKQKGRIADEYEERLQVLESDLKAATQRAQAAEVDSEESLAEMRTLRSRVDTTIGRLDTMKERIERASDIVYWTLLVFALIGLFYLASGEVLNEGGFTFSGFRWTLFLVLTVLVALLDKFHGFRERIKRRVTEVFFRDFSENSNSE